MHGALICISSGSQINGQRRGLSGLNHMRLLVYAVALNGKIVRDGSSVLDKECDRPCAHLGCAKR